MGNEEMGDAAAQLTGIPEEWSEVVLPPDAGSSQTSSSRSGSSKRQRSLSISGPRKWEHRIHVDYDSRTGFSGLPPAWERWLEQANLTRDDVIRAPAAAERALRFKAAGMRASALPARPQSEVIMFSSPKRKPKLRDYLIKCDPSERFTGMDHIDTGSEGTVYKGLDTTTNSEVAIKVIPVQKDTKLTVLTNEIAMMADLSGHPHIVSYVGCFAHKLELWIAMEFVGGGKLTSILQLTTFTEAQTAAICKATLKALQFMHLRRKIHRDIKSDNLLVSTDGAIKLGDFGFCAELNTKKAVKKETAGTAYWMAPEVIQARPYAFKIDVWSLGILAIECAEGAPPLLEHPPLKALFLIVTNPPPTLSEPHKWSDSFRDFLALALMKDPDSRPTADQLMQHPFVYDAADDTGFLAELLVRHHLVK